VQITDEIDGLIHVSDMSWTKRVKHPGDVLDKGDDLRARITNIDVENQRVSLSIKEFLPNEWDSFVKESTVGDTVTGRVVNVTDFGLFVDIYEGLEGLAHVSEIESGASSLEDQYSVGEWVSARILRIEEEDKKVGLTMRGVPQPTADEIAELEAALAAEETEELAVVEELSETQTEGSDEVSKEEVVVEDEVTEAKATAVEELAEVADEESLPEAEVEAEATEESAEEQIATRAAAVAEEQAVGEAEVVDETKDAEALEEEPEAAEVEISTEEEGDAVKGKETVD